jgi:hypothetical protein
MAVFGRCFGVYEIPVLLLVLVMYGMLYYVHYLGSCIGLISTS